jgi:di/tricarboxylate transporter
MGSLFLTGNPGALILIGLVPAEQRSEVSFMSWLLAALPLHLVLFSGTLLFILRRYRPNDEGLSRERLQLQRALLGPVRGGEWLALGVLAVLLVGFATSTLHGIEPAWLAVFGVVAMFAGRLLDAESLRRGVNWQLLLYLGVALSLGAVLQAVGLDTWVGSQLGPLLEAARLPSGLVLLGIGALALLLSLALGTFPAALLLALALFPITSHLGISPMVLAMTLLVGVNQWLYPQQNFLYLSLYSATEQRAFNHAQARPAAIVYAALTLIGIAVSVPCWYRLGLLH